MQQVEHGIDQAERLAWVRAGAYPDLEADQAVRLGGVVGQCVAGLRHHARRCGGTMPITRPVSSYRYTYSEIRRDTAGGQV